MRRLPYLLAAICLALVLSSCGGSSSSSSSVGSTTVAVTVGSDGTTARISTRPDTVLARADIFLSRAGSSLAKMFSTSVATATIPSDITNVAFTISASDMQTITRNVSVNNRPTITETFTVPNGSSRSIKVELKDATGTTQFTAERMMNLDGTQVSMPLTMQSMAAPVFGGVTSATATSATSVDLAWSPASDPHTAASAMIYLVYVATTPGGENYATPSFTTSAGATGYTVQNLTPGTTYYFVVRANNGQYTDANTVEKTATTSATADAVAPTFSGLASATAVNATAGRVDLSWSAASDNVTSAADIVYLIYMSSTSGGQNMQAPSFTSAPGATTHSITGLSVGTYYFKVRARDAAGNVDSNAVEKSATVGTIAITQGNNQFSDLNTQFILPLKVTVANAAAQSVPVTFWVSGAGPSGTFADGTPSGTTTVTVTTVNGVATAPAFTANGTTGTYDVIASTGALSTRFTLTNVALGPFDITNITSGAWDSGPAGTTYIPLQVTVKDVNGAPLPGIPVTFTVNIGDTGSSGTFAGGLTSATAVTNAQGVAAAPALTAAGPSTPHGVQGEFTVTITAAGRTTEAGRQIW